MVLPILAAIGLTEGAWIAIAGLIRLMSWVFGIVWVSSYIRDAITKTSEAEITASQDDVIEEVLSKPDLTSDQKTALIEQYLANLKADSDSKKPIDWEKIVLTVGAAAVITALILSFTKR